MKNILISVFLLILLCGCEFNNYAESNYSNGEYNHTESSITNKDNEYETVYKASTYKVGTDIPSGDYIIFANEGRGYFSINADSYGDSIIENENFNYNVIIRIEDGQYLELSRSYAVPYEDIETLNTTKDGMFKVGVHIEAKEHKLCTNNNRGYYAVYNGPLGKDGDIVTNDNFENCTYISVKEGQYLLLSRAYIQ